METFLVAVGEVVDGFAYNGLSSFKAMALIIGIVLVSSLHLGDGAGGHDLGVEAFGQFGHALHNALNVHNHGFQGAGYDRQFLLEIVPRNRDAVTHEDLVGCAANSTEADAAAGAFALGVLDHLRVLNRLNDDLGQRGLMTVNDDIDRIFLHAA
jgi:hypothetical protein